MSKFSEVRRSNYVAAWLYLYCIVFPSAQIVAGDQSDAAVGGQWQLAGQADNGQSSETRLADSDGLLIEGRVRKTVRFSPQTETSPGASLDTPIVSPSQQTPVGVPLTGSAIQQRRLPKPAVTVCLLDASQDAPAVLSPPRYSFVCELPPPVSSHHQATWPAVHSFQRQEPLAQRYRVVDLPRPPNVSTPPAN